MKINETIRKDGLRIISCYLSRKKTVLVELVARVGYAYDPPEKQGLFHCFEHMAFKGTKKRSIKDLKSFSDKHLFGSNAGTGPTGTTYHTVIIDRKLSFACEYLCDIYFNSTFPAAELEKEKKPILLEIARKNDNDLAMAHQALSRMLYKDNPLRLSASGTVEGVKKIKRSDLLEQKNNWYVPSNTIAIAIGNVNHRDFVKEISKRIPLNFKKVSLKKWADESGECPVKKETIVEKPNREKTMMLLGCKLPFDINTDRKTREAISIFSKLMGSGQNSRLWNDIRENKGLAYAIEGGLTGLPGVGKSFYVYTEVDNSKYAQVGKIIECSLLKPFSEKQKFEDLRERIFDAFEISSIEQDNFGRYEELIWRNIVEGKPVKSVESEDRERREAIVKLTLKDVEKARKRFINMDQFARAIITTEINKS